MNQSSATSRRLVDGFVIVGSIFLAFAVDAWWNGRLERGRREVLMEDLSAELVANRDRLASSLERQQQRVERIGLILDELGPQSRGLAPDSVWALQSSVRGTPTFDPAFGILTLLIESGDLALLQDRQLRSALAGLVAASGDYLFNQDAVLTYRAHAETTYGTGSILRDFSAFDRSDLIITTASPDAATLAAKYLQVVSALTQTAIPQGQELLNELDGIIRMMDAPRER